MNISSNDAGRNSCLKSPFSPSIPKVTEDSKNLDIPTLRLPIIINSQHRPQFFSVFFNSKIIQKVGKVIFRLKITWQDWDFTHFFIGMFYAAIFENVSHIQKKNLETTISFQGSCISSIQTI
ncbi:hypothetical protein CQ056_19110 [Peribacillus simplex]|nr:hypothetical protein CQ056_19110 [Peribacillus simplex]